MDFKKLKVIHIEHCSHSYFVSDKNIDLDDVVKGSWGTQVATQLKKFYPDLDIECWFPEKMEKRKREFQFEGLKMRIFPTTFSPRYALDFSWPMMKALKKEIKKCKTEGKKFVLHIHEIHNLHGLAMLSLFGKEKIICQHHGGSWPLRHLRQTPRYKKFFPLFWLGQLWENLVLKNIDVYFGLTAEDINHMKKVAPNSKVIFQTMGIDDVYFDEVEMKEARKKLGLDVNKKIILFIGRINEEKGIKYLLDAMKSLKDVELKILGFTQQIDYFKEYAKRNNLNNVEFLGGVFGERKLFYLSAADALVLPSSKEGAPVTIMESLARNLPVVVTNVGGVPLMIKNKREGIIIKQKNSGEIVTGVNEILDWKNKNIKGFAEKYRWENIIKDTVEEYERLIKK